MKRSVRWSLLAGASLVAGSGLFLAGRAFAGGVPADAALTYVGTLEDPQGKPALQGGGHNVVVRFYAAATGGSPVCDSGAAKDLEVDANGRFGVALPNTCATQVAKTPNLWSEIVIDGAGLGRSKIGAVPYALEAAHAVNAASATNANHATSADTAKKAESTTVVGIELSAADDGTGTVAPLESHASACVSNPNLINCAVAARRKCMNLGYAGGWFAGEIVGDSTKRAITCVK